MFERGGVFCVEECSSSCQALKREESLCSEEIFEFVKVKLSVQFSSIRSPAVAAQEPAESPARIRIQNKPTSH